MADVCGPWTLEQLDQFGTLDSLPFSLDSDVWLTACIRDSGGDVSAVGSATATPSRERIGEGFVTASATVTATGSKELTGSGAISGAATVVAACARVRDPGGIQDIDAYGRIFVVPGLQYDLSAEIDLFGSMSATATRVLNSSAIITSSSVVYAKGYKYGEEWTNVGDDTNTWTTTAPQSDVWTDTTSGNNSWQQLG